MSSTAPMRKITAPRFAAAALAALALTSCSATERTPPSRPQESPASSAALPPPTQRGPTVVVEGRAVWLTGHRGCAQLLTAAGQQFQLAGDAAASLGTRAHAGDLPAQQEVIVTGYVARVGASVCGHDRTFVADKVIRTRK